MTDDTLNSDTLASLRAIGVVESLVRLVRDVTEQRVIDAEGGDRYVALRPSYDALIACYVNPRFADVRLSAARAVSISRHREWRLAAKNATSGALHVPADALRDPETRAFVVDLVIEALERSARGPGRRDGGDMQDLAEGVDGPLCPVPGCNTVMLGGVCDTHD